MPLKLRQSGPTLPPNFTSMATAWNHFLATWYEKPENPMDAQEIRHAFFAGAIYLKTLVHQAGKKTPPEAQTHISRLYKELIDEAARNAAAPWLPKLAPSGSAAATPPQPRPAQSPGMDLPPPAPDPDRHIVVANTPTQQPPSPSGQEQEAAVQQKPMMWTLSMLQEFAAAHMGAQQAGAATFPFKEMTFRTADAPSIINHLKNVFAKDLAPRPPQQPPQTS